MSKEVRRFVCALFVTAGLVAFAATPAAFGGGEGEGEGEGMPSDLCPGEGGDCCCPHEGPGCDDIDCCLAICEFDPFCCEVEWDNICVDEQDREPLCDEAECNFCGDTTCDTWWCDGDANGDGVVDPLDSGYILARFGLDPCIEGCASDVNCDGAIDPLDSGYALARIGTCDEPPVCELNCD